MKRYRVVVMDFDLRANLPSDSDREALTEDLVSRYGEHAIDQKVADFYEFGATPISVFAYHNRFYHQIREAFIIGAYYPALTAACALGEWILNYMVLHCREDFKGKGKYKEVYRKGSLDWEDALRALTSWDLLLPEAAAALKELYAVRNRSLHFNENTAVDTRSHALEAIRLLHSAIDSQFTAFGHRPWYIPNDLGLSFIRRESEADPFVARVLLPNCAPVGPEHYVTFGADGRWIAVDRDDYPDVALSDEEYIEAFKEYHSRG